MLLDEPTQGMAHEDVGRVVAADQEGGGRSHRPDGGAQPERRGGPVRHHHGAGPRCGAGRRDVTHRCRATRRCSRPMWGSPMHSAVGPHARGRRPARLVRRVAHPARDGVRRQAGRAGHAARSQRRWPHHARCARILGSGRSSQRLDPAARAGRLMRLPPHRDRAAGHRLLSRKSAASSPASAPRRTCCCRRAWARGGMSVDEIYDMFPNLHERRKSPGSRLSGGEQQMLALARILRTGRASCCCWTRSPRGWRR